MTAVKDTKNWLEWTVFAVSLLLVGGAMGALVYEAMRESDHEPPELEVLLGSAVRQSDGDYHVPVRVVNRGDASAGRVRVAVTASLPEGEQERAEIEFEHVPRGSTRKGSIIFQFDPARASSLTADFISYVQP
jgi:uncharacterized protein (TIGR02588 family)